MTVKESDIEALKEGSEEAFKLVISNFQDKVYGLCLKILKHPALAKEAAQDTFIKVFQRASSFKRESRFSTWLYTITYRTALNYIGKEKKHLSEDISYAYELKSSDDTAASIYKSDRRKILSKAISKLSKNEAAIVTLFYYDELSVKEVATITGLEVSNVKIVLFRSRKKMAEILEPFKSDLV